MLTCADIDEPISPSLFFYADVAVYVVRELKGQKCPERGQMVWKLYLTGNFALNPNHNNGLGDRHNGLVDRYNGLVDRYNKVAYRYSEIVDRCNEIVDRYNVLVNGFF